MIANLAVAYSMILKAHKKILGAEHPGTLSSMSNLAMTYSHLNRLEDAEDMTKQSYKKHKKLLGAENPHTLSTMCQLVSIWEMQDWFKKPFH